MNKELLDFLENQTVWIGTLREWYNSSEDLKKEEKIEKVFDQNEDGIRK